MTTTQRIPIPSRPKTRTPHMPNRRRRRLRNYLRTVFSRGDLSSLLIAWGLMIVTAQALNAAEWTAGLGTLATVSVFAVGFGFLLARSHYSELMALILSSVYSLGIVLCVNAWAQVDHGSLWERTDVLASQLNTWLNEAIAGKQPSYDNTAFVIFLSILFWFLGHNVAWHIFRVDRVWRVIIPTGLVLITNQFYYQGDNSLDIYLIAFVVLSLLLLIRSHIETREYEWFVQRVSFPNYVRRRFFQAGGILAVLIVLAAWAAPTTPDDKSLERIEDLLSGDTFVELIDLWNKLFSSLEGEGIATADYYGGDQLKLSGAIKLGDQPVMTVKVPYGSRYYWRSTAYDAYDFGTYQWRHIRTVRAYTDNSGLRLNPGATLPGARTEVDQTFTILIRASELVYAAPQPIELGLPVEVELDCIENLGNECVNQNRPSDVAITRARKPLRRGDEYRATSSISAASAAMLRSAGQEYPGWVLRLYLQGAESVSPRVRELGMQIVQQAGAQTPYDQAKAIERWLRTYIQYNESIPNPPNDRDPIEWFLFDLHEGYCNYYATAMIMMLRTQGIPARLAAGFAQGTWDPEQNAFLVRERDAHTWVEIYFPGYGWIEFEPTADEAPLDRPDDVVPQTTLPTVTPLPTPTPQPTATPTFSPTDPAGANATPTGQMQQPFVASTPTPTPAPTSTPPPPPDVTKVDSDGGSNILRVILLTLGAVVLTLLLVALAVALAIWYIEFRGLGGLNAVQKAYARMAIYARWLGIRFEQSTTPDERRRYLVGQVPEGERPINTITHVYMEERYGEPAATRAARHHTIHKAWQSARRAFIRRKLRRFGRG